MKDPRAPIQNRYAEIRSVGGLFPPLPPTATAGPRVCLLAWHMWIVFRPILRGDSPISVLMGLQVVERLLGRGAGRRDEAREPVRRLLLARPLRVVLAQQTREVAVRVEVRGHLVDRGVREPLVLEKLRARRGVQERPPIDRDLAAHDHEGGLGRRHHRDPLVQLLLERLHSFPSCGNV